MRVRQRYPDRITLVVDLDNTLISCSQPLSSRDAWQRYDITNVPMFVRRRHVCFCRNGRCAPALVRAGLCPTRTTAFLRPYLHWFLLQIGRWYDVVFFSANRHRYVEEIVQQAIDPFNAMGLHDVPILSRKHTRAVDGLRFVKDLSILGKPLHRVALLDDNVDSSHCNPNNFIDVRPFHYLMFTEEDNVDAELLSLLPLLKTMATKPSVFDVLPLPRWSQERQQHLFLPHGHSLLGIVPGHPPLV
jgi:hypothetical protein